MRRDSRCVFSITGSSALRRCKKSASGELCPLAASDQYCMLMNVRDSKQTPMPSHNANDKSYLSNRSWPQNRALVLPGVHRQITGQAQ